MAATVNTLGRVNASTSPVQISASPQRCCCIRFSQIPGMTGAIYVGNATMNKATYAGVYAVLPAPVAGSGVLDRVEIEVDERNGLRLSDWYVDGTSGEGVLVTYEVN